MNDVTNKHHLPTPERSCPAGVFRFDDLMKLKTVQAVKAAGLLRSEVKEYVVKDGNIMLFRFNVQPTKNETHTAKGLSAMTGLLWCSLFSVPGPS